MSRRGIVILVVAGLAYGVFWAAISSPKIGPASALMGAAIWLAFVATGLVVGFVVRPRLQASNSLGTTRTGSAGPAMGLTIGALALGALLSVVIFWILYRVSS